MIEGVTGEIGVYEYVYGQGNVMAVPYSYTYLYTQFSP